MPHIVLIACTAKKAASECRARDLYQSALFKKSLAYADGLHADAILILSAKHGLVPADMVLEPYDESLNDKSTPELRAWAARVLHQLAGVADLRNDRVTILAGDKYRRYVAPALRRPEVPLAGLRIGEQLHRLDELCSTR